MHTLRHSFANVPEFQNLLENGTDLRYIQILLSQSSSKMTEIYTYISTKSYEKIACPLAKLKIILIIGNE